MNLKVSLNQDELKEDQFLFIYFYSLNWLYFKNVISCDIKSL
jgi:hypothetical protein